MIDSIINFAFPLLPEVKSTQTLNDMMTTRFPPAVITDSTMTTADTRTSSRTESSSVTLSSDDVTSPTDDIVEFVKGSISAVDWAQDESGLLRE